MKNRKAWAEYLKATTVLLNYKIHTYHARGEAWLKHTGIRLENCYETVHLTNKLIHMISKDKMPDISSHRVQLSLTHLGQHKYDCVTCAYIDINRPIQHLVPLPQPQICTLQ